MPAGPTACCGLVVMVFLTCWKNVTMEPSMPTNLMLADPGAEFPNVVMVLLILAEVKLVMMETTSMVMGVTAVVDVNVETEELTQVRCAMMDPETAIPDLLAAASTANCQDVVMVSLILMKNVMTLLLETLLVPTLADPIAPFPNVVMVLLITCMVSFATKVAETP